MPNDFAEGLLDQIGLLTEALGKLNETCNELTARNEATNLLLAAFMSRVGTEKGAATINEMIADPDLANSIAADFVVDDSRFDNVAEEIEAILIIARQIRG